MKISCSAVIPVYNAEAYLADAVDSLLNQTEWPEKIVLVDDGSVDGSVELIEKRYATEIESGKLFLHILPENKGVSTARNVGVNFVETDWFVFLDADDVLAPNALELLRKRAEELNAQEVKYCLIHPAYQMIDDKGEITSAVHRWRQVEVKETLGWMFYRNHIISPSGLLVNRSKFMELGGFDETLRYSEDAELWLRFSKTSGIGYVDEPLAFIRRHATNASKQVVNMLGGELTILRRYELSEIKEAILKRNCSPAKNIADFVSILFRLDEWEVGYKEICDAKSQYRDGQSLPFFAGLYWLKQKEWERALNSFLECDCGADTKGAVLNNIGASYLCLGDREKALTYFNRALKMHPNYMDASNNKDLLDSEFIDLESIKFTWRELRKVMISYAG